MQGQHDGLVERGRAPRRCARGSAATVFDCRWNVASRKPPGSSSRDGRVGGTRGSGRRDQPRHVDHHVADHVHPPRDALPLEVDDRGLRRAQEQRREGVRDDAVHLLGHAAVEAAQTRLDVGDRQLLLGCGERGGERRVRVAVDHDAVGPLLADRTLDADEDRPGHLGVAAGADVQADLRARPARAPRRRSQRARGRSAGPVSSEISSTTPASAACSGAALMNCGRFPVIERMRTGRTVARARRRRTSISPPGG